MALKVAEGISLSLDKNLDLVTKCVPIIMKARALRALGLEKFPLPEEGEELKLAPPPPAVGPKKK